MFDLNNIDFKKTDEQHGRRNYSFVGIQRSKDNDRLEFWLPLGFDNFNHGDFEQVKGFFFKMYRTFKTYLQKKQNEMEEEERTINRDGIIESKNGFSFINENKEQTVFYGKLNSLEKIIEGYDELRISSLEKKQVRTHEIDYSKIHRYMHQAVYLDDDVIYLDEMNIAKNVLIKDSPPILQLFCFIYSEIKNELDEFDSIPNKAIQLSEQFKENYLQIESALFGESIFVETVNSLKEILEDIDTQTTYKDEDYWHFFEAVEAFLYGERQENNAGIYWGFSSFYDVWEDMCQTFALNSPDYEPRAIFADVNGILLNRFNLKPNPFELKMNDLPQSRYLRPDLVLLEHHEVSLNGKLDIYEIKIAEYINYKVVFSEDFKIQYPEIFKIYRKYLALNTKYQTRPSEENEWITSFHKDKFLNELENTFYSKDTIEHLQKDRLVLEDSIYRVIDYKYMRLSDYAKYSPFYIDGKGENKVKEDIHKQLVYEWTVQQNWTAKTQSEFWIPFYSSDPSIFEQIEEINNLHFNKSQIKVVKINFKTLQEFYIKQALV